LYLFLEKKDPFSIAQWGKKASTFFVYNSFLKMNEKYDL